MKRIYVGPKQSTIENNNFFDYSITLFGNNDDKNISYRESNLDNILEFEYWNPDSNQREILVYNELLKKISEPCELMAHDYKILSQCDIPKNAKLICKNNCTLINLLNNKIETRNLFKGIVPMLDYKYIKGSNIDYKKLCSSGGRIVVQHPLGSGGSKTFLFDKDNADEFINELIKDDVYAISDYVENNVPYNIHCVISDEQFEIFPPSMQELDINKKIEYIDSNYNIKLNKNLKKKFIDYTTKICLKLKELGYRGIFGIDYIYANDELYFIEINPRFQGSSRKLDKILIDNNFPSIFEYNLLAFENKKMKDTRELKNSVFK